jgi:hypothetical protein
MDTKHEPPHSGTKRTLGDLLLRILNESVVVWLSAVVAFIGVMVAAFTFFIGQTTTEQSRKLAAFDMITISRSQQDRLDTLNHKINEIEQLVSSFSNLPKEDAAYIELRKLEASVKDIASRQDRLEAAIMQDPTKAVAVPILRHDLDSLKDSQQASIAALKDSVDRIYDLSKWLLGAMAISIVTLAIVNLLKQKDPPS